MKHAAVLSLSLGIVCAAAAAVLGLANNQTRAACDAADRTANSRALYQVLPEVDNEPIEDHRQVQMADGTVVTFYRGRKDGSIVAYAGQGVTRKAFGGTMELVVGIDPDGNVRRIVVTKHQETPGLGTEATDRKQPKTLRDLFSKADDAQPVNPNAVAPSQYLDQYNARNLGEQTTFSVSKDGGDIDAVSGATISSRAVADAISQVARAFAEHRDELDKD